MKKLLWIALLLTVFAAAFSNSAFAQSRGLQIVKDSSGQQIALYKESHALLIGASAYNTWPRLHSVPGELQAVRAVLEQQGFSVTVVNDPNAQSLQRAFEDFINKHGYSPENRLLFFFAGHGHTLDNGRHGFLVPVDAPDPRKNEAEFRRRSLSMTRILALCKEMTAKHALFVFDSCFSGTIFTSRELGQPPPHISARTARPVRQFITAGDAHEPVPSQSVFAPSFVRALEGDADLDKDGFVTGSELSEYLYKKVLSYQTGQTPRAGKIRDPELDQGDFVFLLAGSSGVISDAPAPAAPAQALLSVSGNVAGATVYWNNSHLGQVPLQQVRLNPGEGELRVEKQGYSTFRTRVRLDAGREASLTAYLEPATPPKARLFVDTIPSGARVRVLNIGPGYSRGMELEGGSYHIEVTADGYNASSQWVQVDAGQDRYVTVRLERPATPAASGGRSATNSLGMTFVYIPPGTFMMGSPQSEKNRSSNENQHRVTLTKGFWMQTTEVTQGQWKAIMGSNPSGFKDCGDNCPVKKVSWNDAQDFIRRLSQRDGRTYSLPTEAQWEYAARAGSTTPFNTGNCLSTDQANYNGNYPYSGCSKGQYRAKTVKVGSFAPNAWGLYDMHGNVWEWCADWFGDYPSGNITDPTGPSSGSYRVIRGGCWGDDAQNCRSAYRYNDDPVYGGANIGFRVARTE